MSYKNVSAEKLDALVAKHITLKGCPQCGNVGGQIIVDMPLYGKDGAYCKCYQCGFETKRRMTNIVVVDCKKRIATPTIDRSLMGAIRQAVYDWNRRTENEQR